jgi:hypothetical protein
MQVSKERIGCDGNRRLLVGKEADGRVTLEIILQTRGTWGHVATLVLRPEDAQVLIDDLTTAMPVPPPPVFGRRARRLMGV